MLPVTWSCVEAVLHPAMTAAMLTNARARATWLSFFIGLSPSRPSIQNEAVLAVVARCRCRLAGRPIDAVEAAEQEGGRVGAVGKAVIRPRQVLLRDRARDVRCNDHHQLGLAVDVVAALEQRAEHGQLHQAGQAADVVL